MVFKVKPRRQHLAAAVIRTGTYRATVSNLKQFANTYMSASLLEFTIQGASSMVSGSCGQHLRNCPNSPNWLGHRGHPGPGADRQGATRRFRPG